MPWAARLPVAVFRGAGTGGLTSSQRKAGLAKVERRNFVRRFSGSQLIDASINSSRHRTRDELRHFRYLIYLEGNDMGTGLWW